MKSGSINRSDGLGPGSPVAGPSRSHARLISRNRFDTAALSIKDKLAYPVIEPGSWVMERKMLLTIKQRAEQLARKQMAG